MSRLSSFLFGVVVGAGMLHLATNYHVLRAGDGFHLVAKQPARLSESYVDVREFGMADWAGRPQLAAALVQADKQYLLGESAAAGIEESVKQLLPAWPKK